MSSLRSFTPGTLRLGRLTILAVALFGAVSLGGDCDDEIVNDPTFRDWCGDTLCDWTLDTGNISRVPTWYAEDLGVAFNETPTQISQVTSENAATCIEFTSVANTDKDAQMVLEVDFDNDGTVDLTTPISGQWTQFQYEITAPAYYEGITYHIRKEGSGTAILAEMSIQSTTGCAAPPLTSPTLTNLPLGDPCDADDQCASNVCGAAATDDYELSNVCSLCSSQQPCTGRGQTCELGSYGFSQCSPGAGLGVSGAHCAMDSDCASHECDGVVVMGTVAQVDAGTDAGPCPADIGGPDAGSPDGAVTPCVLPPTTIIQGKGGVCH